MRCVLLSLGVLACLAGCASEDIAFEPLGQASAEEGTFRAGAAACEFTPGKGYPLAGYGGGERRVQFPLYWGLGWPGRLSLAWNRWRHEKGDPADFLVPAAGVHDPLLARAVVFVPERGPPFAVVRIDAIESSAAIHDRVAELAKDLGFSRETIILAATHTHSGAGGFLEQPLAELLAMDVYRTETAERIAQAVAGAIHAAHACACPASIGFTRARDAGPDGAPVIARNRRSRSFRGEIAEDDLDRDVELLCVRDRAGRAPIATLACYAVHPTVLGTQNRYFSSDLVAPIESGLVSSAHGGAGIFLNAAEGDVGPAQGSGGLVECRAEGEAMARVTSAAVAAVACSPRARFRGATGTKGMGVPYLFLTPGDRRRFREGDEGAGKYATAILSLPLNLVTWLVGFTNVRFAVTWNFAVGLVVDFSSYGETRRFRGGGFRIESGGEDVFLFACPGEAIHTVGLELKARARARGATRALVVGLADDALSYIASEEEYDRGGYEALMTLWGPHTDEKLYDLERGILDGLGYPAPVR